MAVEIERKFLVNGEGWRSLTTGIAYRQGYLLSGSGHTVRVRIAGDIGYLTIKSASSPPSASPEEDASLVAPTISRSEYEYVIPVIDAAEMLETLCERPLIEKIRYRIPWDDVFWEVDEFAGENQGLVLAEVELHDPRQTLRIPDWIGEEVSSDPRYFNSSLVRHPYSRW